MEGVTGVRAGQALQVLIGALAPSLPAAGPDERLRALGARLEELGTAAPADFEAALSALLRAQLGGLRARLEALLGEYGGQPPYWAEDVRRLLTALREALPQHVWASPTDLRAAVGLERARELFRRLVHQFGDLLRVWPDLVEAARDLRACGGRPAVPA
jgi:hypothetical protein